MAIPGLALNYPDSLPLEDAKELVRIVHAGAVMVERAAFGKHLWVLQGYTQGALLGDPGNMALMDAGVTGAAPAPAHGDPIQVLHRLIAAEEARIAHRLHSAGDLSGDLSSGLTAQSLSPAMALLLRWAVKELVALLAAELGITI